MFLGVNTAVSPFSMGLVGPQEVVFSSVFPDYSIQIEDFYAHVLTFLTESGYSWPDIKGIGVIQGPGKYTSLRVGLSVIKTVAGHYKIPIYGISLLEALFCSASCIDGFSIVCYPSIINTSNIAVFIESNGARIRVTADFSLTNKNLYHVLKQFNDSVYVIGKCLPIERKEWQVLPMIRYNQIRIDAIQIALYAQDRVSAGDVSEYSGLIPVYSHPAVHA